MPEKQNSRTSCLLPCRSTSWTPGCDNVRCQLITEVISELRAMKEADSNYSSETSSCSVFAKDNREDVTPKRKCVRKKKSPVKINDGDSAKIPSNSSDSQTSNSSRKKRKRSPSPKKKRKCPNEGLPLTKVLCNIREAMTIDNKCTEKIKALMDTQKELHGQILHLECREKEGVKMLKRADDMWTSMEEQYKRKVTESKLRQKELAKQLKDLDNDSKKWQNDQTKQELKLKHMEKYNDEIKEKIKNKINDMKAMDLEINDFQIRIESNKKEIESYKLSCNDKKTISDEEIAKIRMEIEKVRERLDQEQKEYNIKEKEAARTVREARVELIKANKVLFFQTLENEELLAEKTSLLEEIAELKEAINSFDEKSKKDDESLAKEKEELTKEIELHARKCIQCHKHTNTDVRKKCTECLRCLKEKDCIVDGDHCDSDPECNCVCMIVKEKFLDNVFDNMYTVLEGEAKTKSGIAVSDVVHKCLINNKNGKIDPITRRILQDFILTTVKKNLELTVVGGAVKTRCEMDKETYDQLMLCLKDVKTTTLEDDKNEKDKKDPCAHFPRSTECHCPGGPENCTCSKNAPVNTKTDPPAEENNQVDVTDPAMCPYLKETPCGPECAKKKPCNDYKKPEANLCDCLSTRKVSKNARAQYVLTPSNMRPFTRKSLGASQVTELDSEQCRYHGISKRECSCEDIRSIPRQRMVEEVMGKYTEIPPTESFSFENNLEVFNDDYECSYLPLKYLLPSNLSKNKITRSVSCPSNHVLNEVQSLIKKKPSVNIQNSHHKCKSSFTTNSSPTGPKQIRFPNLNDNSDCDILSSVARSSISCESQCMKLKESTTYHILNSTETDDSKQARKMSDISKNDPKDMNTPNTDIVWITKGYSDKASASSKSLKPPSNDTLFEKELVSEHFSFETDNKPNSIVQSAFLNDESIGLKLNGFSELRLERQKELQEYNAKLAGNVKLDLKENYKTKISSNVIITVSMEDIKIRSNKLKKLRKCLRNTGEGTSRQLIKDNKDNIENKSSPSLSVKDSHRQSNYKKKTRANKQKRSKLNPHKNL